MPRPLKFRAWDIHRKIMLENHTFKSIGVTGLYNWEDCIWEQYTGLKDVNGIEIYEGDKVKHPNFPEVIEEVYWNQGECCFACRGGVCESWLTVGYEIVGHCHE